MTTPKLIITALGASALLATTSPAQAQDFKVAWKGAPEISSADGNFKMKIRGRLLTDWATISDNSDKVTDTTELRTARLGIEGVVMKDVKYKFEVDFAGNSTTIKDAYMQWALKPVSIIVGQHKVPVSLEEQTSGRYTTFMERSGITDAFGFSRNIGISANITQDDFTIKAGVFQGNSGANADEEGPTYAVRGTYATKLDGGMVHVGASAFKRENDDGDIYNRYRQRPHSHLSPTRYVNTDSFDAKSDTFFGVELAGVMGPLSVQSEWGWMKSTAATAGRGDLPSETDVEITD
jgi:phosphate-selective porin OprO/OprP